MRECSGELTLVKSVAKVEFVRHKWRHGNGNNCWVWKCGECGAKIVCKRGGMIPSANRMAREGIDVNCAVQRFLSVADVLES